MRGMIGRGDIFDLIELFLTNTSFQQKIICQSILIKFNTNIWQISKLKAPLAEVLFKFCTNSMLRAIYAQQTT